MSAKCHWVKFVFHCNPLECLAYAVAVPLLSQLKVPVSKGATPAENLFWSLCTIPKQNCPSSPVPCWPALTLLWLQLGTVTLSCCSVVTAQWEPRENTLLTFLWLILCYFGHRWPSQILGFLDNARRQNRHDYTCPQCTPVLVHEQP